MELEIPQGAPSHLSEGGGGRREAVFTASGPGKKVKTRRLGSASQKWLCGTPGSVSELIVLVSELHNSASHRYEDGGWRKFGSDILQTTSCATTLSGLLELDLDDSDVPASLFVAV